MSPPRERARLAPPEPHRHGADGNGLHGMAPHAAQHGRDAFRVQHVGTVRLLRRQLDVEGRIGDMQALCPNPPPHDLAQALVGFLGGAGTIEPVHPLLQVVGIDVLDLARTPPRQHVEAHRAVVSRHGRGAALLRLLRQVVALVDLRDVHGSAPFRLKNPRRFSRVSNHKRAWDFPGSGDSCGTMAQTESGVHDRPAI